MAIMLHVTRESTRVKNYSRAKCVGMYGVVFLLLSFVLTHYVYGKSSRYVGESWKLHFHETCTYLPDLSQEYVRNIMSYWVKCTREFGINSFDWRQ